MTQRMTNKFRFLICKVCDQIADHAYYTEENEKRCTLCNTITPIK